MRWWTRFEFRIRDKLSELVVNYKRLTEYYRRITEFGDEEVLLIDQGDMESLLGILREKEEIMIEVSRCQEQVGKFRIVLQIIISWNHFQSMS